MVTIREEIEKVATGEFDRTDNPLRNAPHTLAMLAGEWQRPYPRTTAVYPVRGLQGRTYLSPVRRIDQAYGRSEEHTSELQSRQYLVCRLLLEKKKIQITHHKLSHYIE